MDVKKEEEALDVPSHMFDPSELNDVDAAPSEPNS